MRLPILYTYVLLLIIGLWSCGTSPHTSDSSELTVDERIQEIEDLEKVMFSYERSSPDSVRVLLMDGYEEFANDFPKHELAASYLSRSANIARTFKQFERCIQNYQRIIRDYPEFEKIIEMKFLVAFVYDDGLKDKNQAEKLYKEIARDHPEHVFGQNAQQRLKTLHMTDEELIEHFEKLNSN